MVSSWDRRIGDVPAASDMNSSVRVDGYEIISLVAPLGQRTEVTSTGSRHSSDPALIPTPCFPPPRHRGRGESFPLCSFYFSFVIPTLSESRRADLRFSALSTSSASLSQSSGMAYDFASRQSRIRPAKAGDWFAFLWSKTETGARKAQHHTGADFRLNQDRNPHASSAGGGQIQPVARWHLQQRFCPCLFPLPWPGRRPNYRRLSASFRRRPSRFDGNRS